MARLTPTLLLLLVLCGSSTSESADKKLLQGGEENSGRSERPALDRQKQPRSEKTERDLTQGQSKRLIGRHVCALNKVVMRPVKDLQSYCKPSYRSYLKRCEKDSSKFCTGYRVVYEVAYRTVQRFLAKTESLYSCCPGWTSSKSTRTDCKKALCSESCRNGGHCSKPDRCACPAGWTGKACETDVDECTAKEHICHHLCANVPGSYKCECEAGYVLQPDKKSCKKVKPKPEEIFHKEDDTSERIKILEKRMSGFEDLSNRLDALASSVQQILSQNQAPSGSESGEDGKKRMKEQIDSLSDQIAILEERLAECSCDKKETLFLPHHQR